MTNRTFIMCKPDAVERGLVGEVIARFERQGLKLARVAEPPANVKAKRE